MVDHNPYHQPPGRGASEGYSLIEALRRSEERLSLVLDAADLGLWDWDIRSNRLYWSERCLTLFGLPRDTGMTYDKFLQAVHPDDRERTHQAVLAALEEFRKYDVEIRTLWPDGTLRWIHTRGRAFYAEGRAVRMSGVAWDVTEWKDAEDALRKSERRFRDLAESLPQLVWVTNAEGENVYCNSRFEEYTGLAPHKLMGHDWHSIIHPEDLPATVELWTQCVQQKTPFLIEYRLHRYDGAWRHFLGRALPLLNENGQVEQWVGSSTDIHDRKCAEEALRRAEKLAVTGRFATSIAHEINNPLMSVTQLLYLLHQDESLGEDGRELLNKAERELARVAQVVAHMLHFKRSARAPRKADLREVVESVLVLFDARFASAGIRVVRDFAEPAEVVCYRDELAQAIANLVGNAYDAMRRGGTLKIRIRPHFPHSPERRAGLRITVADAGSGISNAIRRVLFEPFSTTKESIGVGLGLWTTLEIVRRHRGRIAARSSQNPPRAGTTISIFLPFDALADDPPSDSSA